MDQVAPNVPSLPAGERRTRRVRAVLGLQAAIFVLLLLVGAMPFARPVLGATCNDVVARGSLNVLTINLMFAEIQTRNDRLRQIATFAAQNSVDVILLQEVVAGPDAGITAENSAVDLREMLLFEGLDFEPATAVFEAGRPDIFAITKATLSRCEILQEQTVPLQAAFEPTIKGGMVQIPRNTLMTLLDVPEFGRVSVYNTHLCAGCTPAERTLQVEAILGSINQRQAIQPRDRLTLLGGDFNIDMFGSSENRADYDRIRSADFVDATAVALPPEELCEDPQVPDEHCTIGVPQLLSSRRDLSSNLALNLANMDVDLPLSLELPSTGIPSARRIDYLFVRNPPSTVEARVVFNPLIASDQLAVSDHAGILASFGLATPITPRVTEPKVTEPKVTEPKVTEPKVDNQNQLTPACSQALTENDDFEGEFTDEEENEENCQSLTDPAKMQQCFDEMELGPEEEKAEEISTKCSRDIIRFCRSVPQNDPNQIKQCLEAAPAGG